MAEDPPVGDRRYITLEDVQVGAADRYRVDPHDRIGIVLNRWFGYLLQLFLPGP